MSDLSFISKLKGFHQVGVEQICAISRQDYDRVHERLATLISDVVDLYEGRWTSHEACQVGYHNFDHALDVALAVARMAAGWNKTRPNKFPEDVFLVGMAASFFHDSGYIKDKGDMEGKGGKYTFSHVGRSQKIADAYLRDKGWSEASAASAVRMIAPTEFYEELAFQGVVDDDLEKVMTAMVVSADLVAQMADVDYLHRITYLFDEFLEGYKAEGPEALAEKGIRVFESARDIIAGTQVFYDNFVLPRLEKLGRMDKYLVAFFGDDRNPYQENITANLSGQLQGHRRQWQRLGEVLQEQGIVSSGQIKKAIDQQASLDDELGSKLDSRGYVSKRLLERMNTKQSTELLGEILMEMEAINPVSLCKGLMSQLLPPALLESLSREELIFLLNISMLLQNYQRGSKVFNHILEMTNELLGCEASSILLADLMTDEIVIAIPTGPQREILEGERFPLDKGLAGWVYQHGQPVSVKNVRQDERFDDAIDVTTSFVTRSILAVPLHINGVWIGVIELLNKKDDNFTEHDMDLITSLVNIIGSALGSTLLNSN